MNCVAARECLPGMLYRELAPEQQAQLEQHLANCPACTAEYGTLQQLRRSLDVTPVPSARVDLSRLYQQAARHQARRLRRWRRVAAALLATAAALLLVFALKLEVRADGRQFVIRWGAPPEMPVSAPAPQPTEPVTARPVVTAEEMQLLKDLVHALAADVEARDQRTSEALARLRARLLSDQTQADERWQETERDMAALYVLSQKGGRQ